MLKKVKLRKTGKIVSITQSDVLGTGGEATVVKGDNCAIKIYHSPDSQRMSKVNAWVSRGLLLPSNVCAPQDLVLDNKDSFVGFTMPLIPRGSEVVQQLCSRSFRNAHPDYSSRFVADLFINAYETMSKLHAAGIIVGDFNDLNVMFRQTVMTYIDVDSFQFDKYPCMVGTENFLAPELYNLDLTKRPYFKPEHDWYAFFVMLIRSLLMTHVYGGVHRDLRSIPQRALAKVTVFDSSVKYPKPAYSPDLLDDNLHALIDRMFKKGERWAEFPVQTLREYRESLVECKSCRVWHPAERKSCPQCSTINTQQIQRRVQVVQAPGKRTVNCQEIFATTGSFVWWKPVSHKFYAIALEKGMYTLYKRESLAATTTRMQLFTAKNDPKFDLFDDKYLVVNQDPSTDELLILDISGDAPVGYTKKAADEYDGRRMFAGSRNHLLRVQQGYIYRGSHIQSIAQFGERQVIAVTKDQTWLTASSYGTQLFGYQRFFNVYEYFLYRFDRKDQGERYVVPIPALDPLESLLDVSVEFWTNAVLLMMKTEIKGKTYTRVFVIGGEGQILSQYRVESLSSDTHRQIRGKAFAKPSGTNGVIIHPTDDGVVQQIVGNNDIGQLTLFGETEQFVSETDSLMIFRDGIMVVGNDAINYLVIGS